MSRTAWWLIGIAVVVVVGCVGVLAYLGIYGPDTAVYTGNRVPSRFLRTIKSVGALDEDETILFFYSDALTDIRDGFYFVSNKKVAIYIRETDTPLTAIPFQDIARAELHRSDSFLEDSQITLYLHNGNVHSLPVSNEHDGDRQFFDAIQQRIGNAPRRP